MAVFQVVPWLWPAHALHVPPVPLGASWFVPCINQLPSTPTLYDLLSSCNNVRPRMGYGGNDKTISSLSKGLLCFPSLSVLLPPQNYPPFAHVPRLPGHASSSGFLLPCLTVQRKTPTLGVLGTARWPLHWNLFQLSAKCRKIPQKGSRFIRADLSLKSLHPGLISRLVCVSIQTLSSSQPHRSA